jgi:hypothetical protein
MKREEYFSELRKKPTAIDPTGIMAVKPCPTSGQTFLRNDPLSCLSDLS